jgi:hypothetical protein
LQQADSAVNPKRHRELREKRRTRAASIEPSSVSCWQMFLSTARPITPTWNDRKE